MNSVVSNLLRFAYGWGIALAGGGFAVTLSEGGPTTPASIAAGIGSFCIGFGAGGWDER